MDEYIIRTQPKLKKYDGSLSLQGYGKRKQMFIDFIKQVTIMGKNVVFVAHEKEDKQGEEIKVRPEIGGSSYTDLMKELDLVGYMEMIGGQRTISFDPCEKYYAKNTCNMQGKLAIPQLIDAEGTPTGENKFMQGVIAAYQERQNSNLKQTAAYEQLCKDIAERVDAIENAKDANDFIAWMGEVNHVFNSKAKAQIIFSAKVKSLALVYDKSTKQYADAAAE
jgi:hypothetical protein